MVLSSLQFFHNHWSFHWCKEQTNIPKLYMLSFKIFFILKDVDVWKLVSDNLVFRVLSVYGKRVIKLYGMIMDIVGITHNFLNSTNTTLIFRQPLTREPLVSCHVLICHCLDFRGMEMNLGRFTEVTKWMKMMTIW